MVDWGCGAVWGGGFGATEEIANNGRYARSSCKLEKFHAVDVATSRESVDGANPGAQKTRRFPRTASLRVQESGVRDSRTGVTLPALTCNGLVERDVPQPRISRARATGRSFREFFRGFLVEGAPVVTVFWVSSGSRSRVALPVAGGQG